MSEPRRPARGRGQNRNQRMFASIQQSLGGGGRSTGQGSARKPRPKPRVPHPASFADFLALFDGDTRRDFVLKDYTDYYLSVRESIDEDEVTECAEKLFRMAYTCEAIYDVVAFLGVAFIDDRLQEKISNEFIICTASLLDQEESEPEELEQFGRFVGLILKTKFSAPYHRENNNRLLSTVIAVVGGFLDEISGVIEALADEEVEEKPDDGLLSKAILRATAVVWMVKTLNRRLYMDYFELNDKIYMILRNLLCDTDGRSIGRGFRRLLLNVIVEMEKYSVGSAGPSKTDTGTQTVEADGGPGDGDE